MGDLVDLTYIKIDGQVTGGIPKEFGALTKLETLDLCKFSLKLRKPYILSIDVF